MVLVWGREIDVGVQEGKSKIREGTDLISGWGCQQMMLMHECLQVSQTDGRRRKAGSDVHFQGITLAAGGYEECQPFDVR